MTKKSKTAIVHCVHHKPWLIMSTLITTHSQKCDDFDIYFLINKGKGNDIYREKYREYYDQYYTISNQNKGDFSSYADTNMQLDDYDADIEKYCQLDGSNINFIEYENDHGLDSGAWLKFIKSGIWKKYDHVLFAGEGVLLTRESSLRDMIKFSSEKDANFITSGQEKRIVSKDKWTTNFMSSVIDNRMSRFHDEMIKQTYKIFCRDDNFVDILKKWSVKFDTEQHAFIPNVWGFHFRLIRYIKSSLFYGLSKIVNSKEIKLPKILINGRLRAIKEKNLVKIGSTNFITEQEVGWYGATCNHLMTNKMLKKIDDRFKKYSIYDVIDLPFSATAMEQIWGLIPYSLGETLWFTDGLHRIRKNCITFEREDYPTIMERYLNHYYKKIVNVRAVGDKIRIMKIIDNKNQLINLPSLYK